MSHTDNCETDYKHCHGISWKTTLRQTAKKKIVIGKIVSKLKNFCLAKNTNVTNNSKNNDNTSNNSYSTSIENKGNKIAKRWYRAIAGLRSRIDSTYRAWKGST